MRKSSFPRKISAFLLDCDGVLVDTLELSDRAWRLWAKQLGLDPELVVSSARGRRASETIASLLPSAKTEVIEFYLNLEINLEIQTAAEAKACPGAREFLDILDQSAKWAIVTSASKTVTAARLSAASLPMPPVIVAAEDVTRGKPAPECYITAANRIGVPPERCLALDDLYAGIQSAREAGTVAVLVGTESHAITSVQSLRHIHLVECGEDWEVHLG